MMDWLNIFRLLFWVWNLSIQNLCFLQKRRQVEVLKEIPDKVSEDPTFLNASLLVMRRGFMNFTTVQQSIEWRFKHDSKSKKPKFAKGTVGTIPDKTYNKWLENWIERWACFYLIRSLFEDKNEDLEI